MYHDAPAVIPLTFQVVKAAVVVDVKVRHNQHTLIMLKLFSLREQGVGTGSTDVYNTIAIEVFYIASCTPREFTRTRITFDCFELLRYTGGEGYIKITIVRIVVFHKTFLAHTLEVVPQLGTRSDLRKEIINRTIGSIYDQISKYILIIDIPTREGVSIANGVGWGCGRLASLYRLGLE